MTRFVRFSLIALFALALVPGAIGGGNTGNLEGTFKSDYYADWPLFHMYPNEKDAKNVLKRIGPTGLSLELLQPAFTMRISGIEAGSPAAATGKLQVGQYIDSINGQVLKDIDPRVILGNLITEAEATDGKLKLLVRDDPKSRPRPVEIRIPVMGAYSETWPLNCEKSDRIVREFADFLAEHPRGWGSALFLLSTGEEKDLDVVRGWFSGKLGDGSGGHPWSIGYTGPAICEYYLRTGDESVLPAIQGMADRLKETIYNGGWAGRGGAPFQYMMGGHMNAAGVHCVTFLLLAKECGVDVDEYTLRSSLEHFYRYAGHENVSYGDGVPEGGGVDNGKNGGLAFAMAAAAALTQGGEDSTYAKARDIQANKSFYTTSWLFHGHTGGGIGEIWRGASMGLLAQKRPQPYRSFMNERRWIYELARGHDGSFGFSSTWNVNYDSTGHEGGRSWGNYVPLIYTVPRQKLRIFGAPPSKYSKRYTLPDRPWGTAADEAFFSLEAGEYAPRRRHDMDGETLAEHAAWPTLRKLGNPKVSDETLVAYAHHPDSTSRQSAAGNIRKHNRNHLILPLLKSKDPRARHVGASALLKNKDALSPPVVDQLVAMIADSDESWWVTRQAMRALSQAPPAQIARSYDRLVDWLQHDDWWMRQAAMEALTPLATDPKYYQQILPILGDLVATNQRAAALGPMRGVVDSLRTAKPEIQQEAREIFGEAYLKFPADIKAPGGQDLKAGAGVLLDNIARDLARMPGGFDTLYAVSQKRFPGQALPHKQLYLGANPDNFGPKVREAFKPLVLDYLIPQYIGGYNHVRTNSDYLLAEAASAEPWTWGYYYREPRMEGLVRLYQRVGIHDYDWQVHGTDMPDITWRYHSFDPGDDKVFGGTRYRDVTVPSGMQDWYAKDFDSKAAGWKTGKAPFGQVDGKLASKKGNCGMDFCRCGEPRQSLWEHEVLLMHTRIRFPRFKEGHRYRLVVGGMSHVNSGEGFRIYLNGQELMERKKGVGRREGGVPICYWIEKDLWPAFDEPVTISAIGFLQHNFKTKKTEQHFSIWLQEMKVPPITDDMIQRGKSLQPLANSAWQSSQEDADRYHYDGEPKPDKAFVGRWTPLGQVRTIDDFEPGATLPKATMSALQLRPDGSTHDDLILWTESTLMDLHRYEALSMETRSIDGSRYLFIETGGFDKKHPEGWTTTWTVLARQ